LVNYGKKEGTEVVVLSAKIEAEIAQLAEAERKEFLESLGLKESGLDQLVRAAQKLLHLMTFFTSGPDESRAWGITEGTTAPKAAGKIHSDLEKNFARARIYSYEDIVTHGSEAALKEKGLIRFEGRDYVMKATTSSNSCRAGLVPARDGMSGGHKVRPYGFANRFKYKYWQTYSIISKWFRAWSGVVPHPVNPWL